MTKHKNGMESNIPSMNQSQLYDYLIWCLQKMKNLLIVGRPGIGKTDIFKQACSYLKYRFIIAHPVVHNPTHYSGLGFVLQGDDGLPKADFYPYGFLNELITTTSERLVLLFDDMGQATNAVQAAMMQLFLERAINTKKISDTVSFVGATNRREDKAAVGGVIEPLKSRFDGGIIHMVPELDPWCKWAFLHKMPVNLIAYARFKPEVISDWEPSADLVNNINPRTLAFVGEAINDGLPEDMWPTALAGMIGVGRTAEFISFNRHCKEIPNPDAIIMNPDVEVIPQKPEIQYALTTTMAVKARDTNIDAILKYFERWFDGGNFKDNISKAEMVLAFIKDVGFRNPAITKTQGYLNWFLKHNDVFL